MIGITCQPRDAGQLANRSAAPLQEGTFSIKIMGWGNQFNVPLIKQGDAITECREDVGVLLNQHDSHLVIFP